MNRAIGRDMRSKRLRFPLIAFALTAAVGACTAHTKGAGAGAPTPTVTVSPSVSPSTSLPAIADPPACAATTSWEAQTSPAVVTARLVGRWVLCSGGQGESFPSGYIFPGRGLPGSSAPGLEFTADHHWYKLDGTDPASLTRMTGPDNDGTWAQKDQSGSNKHWPWLLQMRVGQRGTDSSYVDVNSFSFAATEPKMQLGPLQFAKLQPDDSQRWLDLTPSGFTRRAGAQAGFAIDIPRDWKGGWFEGTWDFEPKGLPSTSEDGSTFSLTVSAEKGSYTEAFAGAATTPVIIQGHNAVTTSPDSRHVFFAVDWQMCPNFARRCSTADRTRRLIMRLSASTDAFWTKYESAGRLAAQSVRQYDGSDPVYGLLTGTTNENEYGKAVIRFLDARVEGVGAEDLMCCDAPKFYRGFGGLYALNGSKVVSYEAKFSRYLDSASAQLSVTVHFANGKTRDELLIASYQDGAVTLYGTPRVSSACTGCD